jgi:hypothetical protein
LPGGSAVTSFLSGTEMSISFRGMGVPRDGPFCFEASWRGRTGGVKRRA